MASSSSSSSSSQSWNHDVFLSFRGEDTRKTFVDHLYSALVLQGIDTYKDDETLPQGELIGTSLMKAIEEALIVVIVFSINYADSSWCLDEVAHIMKCKDMTGKIIMPIFYDVDPSIVRNQKEKYGEAFARHKLENKNKVEYWKKALVDASSISGWELKNIANGHESKAIKEIVDKISSRLQLVTASSANEKLIGIAHRMQRLKSALQIRSGGVRMIGIWGVGGGGKTTLASCIYDEISKKFDGCCFIANIREESNRRGLKELEKDILSQTGAYSAGRGRCLKDKKLCNRRVLIVLDDVDQLDQLEALAGSPDWFGDGSRILITTRDEHLLKAHEVVVHDISLLHGGEAIDLFCKHAFRGSIPMEKYEQLSIEVVSYAGGLPLALTVLGSSLCDKNIDQWRSALARLKEIPDNKILEKLKVSFDGLTKVHKDLFLDIACFFRWEEIDIAMEKLDACGFYPVIGVEELRQKALITILDGNFDMHDLVQEMGHYIVRGDYPKNPEKHSRIWKKEDVERICAMDASMELDKIEAIQVHYDEFQVTLFESCKLQEPPPPPIVANMRNLRYIRWKGDLANPLHDNFPPRELCCLVLRGGIQDQLWNGCKVLPNLKMMELYELDNLIMTPNFDGIPYLERFKLWRCGKLEEIHSSFGRLDRLVCLSIGFCMGIKRFPSITRLKKLETLSFTVSRGVFKLSKIQEKIDNFLGEKDMSSGVWELSNLNHIKLCFFRRDLKELDLSWCNLGDEDMSYAIWELPNLQKLNLSDNKFSRLDFSLIRTPLLKFLDVSNCACLVELSNLPSSIAVVEAYCCTSLKTFGSISNCKWLWKLSLRGVYNLSPLLGYMLLDSMLKGNAIEDHLMSVILDYEIPKEFVHVGRLFRGNTFRMRLPDDWYNHFSGFLIHVVTHEGYPNIKITIKEVKPNDDLPFKVLRWYESNKGIDRCWISTYVGYVSINSLRPTTCLNSTYNVISISLHQSGTASGAANRIGVSLVPKKRCKDDPVKTSDSSEFWNEKDKSKPTFAIKRGSKSSSIKILWQPHNVDNYLFADQYQPITN
ncbi:unnamed protein product [Lactuca virosa]|uniref:ADP-ribosyl cyclase/cyclic ADP-ribose hydrolase n=1 Tax=Lactuca virosa TaxID=75947 RepID=A0AAU9N8C8_9ASTR|nr:unnamed protein product [Lactuca virosa]